MGLGWQKILGLGLIIFCPKFAIAGAWIPNNGKTELIFSANTLGNDTSHALTMEYYVARGIGHNTALIFSQNFKYYENLPMISKTDLKMQFTLYQGQGFVVSSQLGISTIDNAQFSQHDDNNLANLLLGYGFGKNWLNLEYGFEKCYGVSQKTSEVTFGRHIYKNDLLIIKQFNAGCDYYMDDNNFQLSYIKQINRNLGVEFGLRQSKSQSRFDQSQNHNSGIILSLWKKY